MSLRHRARVLEATRADEEEADHPEEEDESEEEEESSAAKPNLFALLGGDDDEVDDDAEDEEDTDTPSKEEPSPSTTRTKEKEEGPKEDTLEAKDPAPALDEDIRGDTREGSKKSKKKKNKKKNKANTKGPDASESSTQDDDIDLLCQEIEQSTLPESGTSTSTNTDSSAKASGSKQATPGRPAAPLLAADTRHIKAEDELKRIFGARTLQGERDVGERKKGRGMQPRGMAKMGPKNCILVSARDNWPRVSNGLSMEVAGTEDGVTAFRYTHSYSYLEVQQQYVDCIESHNPNILAQLVGKHPFHVDALLALSDIYQQMNELNTSQELVERCLYSLECAWHPWFAPGTATSRLPYKFEENQPFYQCMFKHIKSLGRRGCHRSALECCKLLLSLDPNDPMGVLCCIDYYAIMSEQYGLVTRLVNEFSDGSRSLALQPGFAFALALSRFRQEEESKGGGSGRDRRGKGPAESSDSSMSGADRESSTTALRAALLMFPGALQLLIDKLNEKSNAVVLDQKWGVILASTHFGTKKDSGYSPTLLRLLAIFIERHHLLWRPPEVQSWLKQVAGHIVDELNLPPEEQMTRAAGCGTASDWAAVIEQTFPYDEPDECTHLTTAAFSDTISVLPAEENPFANADPAGEQWQQLPPELLNGGRGQMQAADAAAQQRQVEELRDGGALMAFLRTMLPWVNVNEMNDGELAALAQQVLEAQEAEGGGHGADDG